MVRLASNDFSIDVEPDYMTWPDWQGSIIHILGEQNFPYTDDEDNWREFANGVLATPAFAKLSLASPEEFESWQDWATDLITVANGDVYG